VPSHRHARQADDSSNSQQSQSSSTTYKYSEQTVRVFCSSTESSNSQNATSSQSKGANNGQARQSFSFKKGNKIDDSATNCDGDSFIVGVKGEASGDDYKITLVCAKRQGLKRESECHEVNGALKANNPNQILNAPTKLKGCAAELAVALGI
jgi:hypothetical protein